MKENNTIPDGSLICPPGKSNSTFIYQKLIETKIELVVRPEFNHGLVHHGPTEINVGHRVPHELQIMVTYLGELYISHLVWHNLGIDRYH